jgi:hypothetical protein
MTDLAKRGPLGQKTGNPKKTPAGKAHMAKVAKFPCVICGARPVEVHHVISGRYSQRKASDLDTIPLCWNHHQGPEGIHTDKALWEAKHGPDTGYLNAKRPGLA